MAACVASPGRLSAHFIIKAWPLASLLKPRRLSPFTLPSSQNRAALLSQLFKCIGDSKLIFPPVSQGLLIRKKKKVSLPLAERADESYHSPAPEAVGTPGNQQGGPSVPQERPYKQAGFINLPTGVCVPTDGGE